MVHNNKDLLLHCSHRFIHCCYPVSRSPLGCRLGLGVCIRPELGTPSPDRRRMLASEVSRHALLVRTVKRRRKNCCMWPWEILSWAVGKGRSQRGRGEASVDITGMWSLIEQLLFGRLEVSRAQWGKRQDKQHTHFYF